MTVKEDAGRKIYKFAAAASSLSLSPLVDRAAVCTRIYVDKPSAADTWLLTCEGRDISQFDIETTGKQQVLSGPESGYPSNNDLFDVAANLMNEPLVYPVPLGQTLKIASAASATANLMFEYEERDASDITPAMMNHPNGRRFVVPVYFYLNASTTALLNNKFDSQIGPSWFYSLFQDGAFPPGLDVRILCLFLEGKGRNTFSGSADHQSVTSYLSLTLNGQQMFTRDSAGGIPLVGAASATGSANGVLGTDLGPFPAFQLFSMDDYNPALFPIHYRQGYNPQWRLNLTGDVTGGASYADARQLALVDYRVTS